MRRVLIIAAYVAVFWIVLPAALALPAVLWPLRWNVAPAYAVVGRLCVLAGGAIMLQSALVLARHGKGLPISHLPPVYLVKSGPYCFSRHPVYFSYAVALAGAGLLGRSYAILIVSLPLFVTAVLLYVHREERELLRRFGRSYELYRKEVPCFVPSVLMPLTWLARAACLLLFRLRTVTRDRGGGGRVVVCPHTNYLDPLFLFLTLTEPIHYLVTHDMYRSRVLVRIFKSIGSIQIRRYRPNPGALLEMRRLVADGGVVGVFPDGGRSWYGDGCYSLQLEEFLRRLRIPVVPAHIDGAYAAWPRWNGIRLGRVTVRMDPRLIVEKRGELGRILSELRRSGGGKHDHRGSGRRRRMNARGIETILYLCPTCGAVGGLSTRGPEIRCTSCSAQYPLRPDMRLGTPAGPVSLPEMHCLLLSRLKEVRHIESHGYWTVEHGLSRDDTHHGHCTISATPHRFAADGDSGSGLALHSHEIEGVVIRGRSQLQVFADTRLHTFTVSDLSPLLFQDYLRMAAFGNPFQKHRAQVMLSTNR